MTVLKLANVTFNFSQTTKPALHEINYEVHKNDFIILLGHNGSGKSTLLKVLHRYYRPQHGNIHFLGLPMHDYHSQQFAHKVSVLTQNCDQALFTSLTVFENYLLVKRDSIAGTKQEREFLINYLADYNSNLCHKLDDQVASLSGGEKQVLALAFCLLHPPELLLLDEHTSALDPKISDQIMQITAAKIKEHGITCVLTTHDLDIALAYGNRIVVLQNGKVHKTYNESEKTSLTKAQILKDYF